MGGSFAKSIRTLPKHAGGSTVGRIADSAALHNFACVGSDVYIGWVSMLSTGEPAGTGETDQRLQRQPRPRACLGGGWVIITLEPRELFG